MRASFARVLLADDRSRRPHVPRARCHPVKALAVAESGAELALVKRTRYNFNVGRYN